MSRLYRLPPHAPKERSGGTLAAMTNGGALALILIGLLLRLALTDPYVLTDTIDLHVVGAILIGIGLVILLINLVLNRRDA